MSIFELHPLVHLTGEFRLSMRRLLQDLCQELEDDYAELTAWVELPIGFFRLLAQSLPLESYSGWKVVGWIEALNDLVYFLDILQQWRVEEDRSEFADQLFAECQEKFFEHSYFDDLFPSGRPRIAGLDKRLASLCARLAREVTQEALWFHPAWPVKWCRQRGRSRWDVPGTLLENFERADRAGTLSVGISGGEWCQIPHATAEAIKRQAGRVVFRVDAAGLALKCGRTVLPVWTGSSRESRWHLSRHPAIAAIETSRGPVTVGPTLIYGKDREPRTVVSSGPGQVERIRRAWKTIQQAWPEGHEVLALLTSRIVPLKAKGVVSFSYRHRPGLSFINCFDRDNLDLIDDLVHENSHHHLNLLLRKHVMYHGDHNQQIFYSPWRRSLRPLRGILHAAFTFTMGALLFERLSYWAETKNGGKRWKAAGLTQRDLMRARFRCLEEIESVRYSIQDLEYAGRHLKWLTGSGGRLVGQLDEAITKAEQRIARHRSPVLTSKFGPALRRHHKELLQARQTYGPVKLSKA